LIAECEKGRRDEHLVRRAVEGDQAALETLFTRYRPHLYKTALRLCGSPEDAGHALEDGLFSAFRHLDHFQARSQFSTWLTRVIINAALMQRRHQGRRVMIPLDGEASHGGESHPAHAVRDQAPDPETAYAEREAFEILRRRLNTMPQAYRDALRLRRIQGFTTHEAADALGVPGGTIKSALHRACAKLADLAGGTTVLNYGPLRLTLNPISKARKESAYQPQGSAMGLAIHRSTVES
jgi:RNA polymerase sigma-70 factor (ECF subfamily)